MHNDIMMARTRVMVVTQGMRSRLRVADRLASNGYEVVMGHELDETLKQLSIMRPDAVVLDFHLPIPNGLEVLRLIELHCPKVPVFTTTQNGQGIVRLSTLRGVRPIPIRLSTRIQERGTRMSQ